MNLCNETGQYETRTEFNKEIEMITNDMILNDLQTTLECHINNTVPWIRPDYSGACGTVNETDNESSFQTCSDNFVRFMAPPEPVLYMIDGF